MGLIAIAVLLRMVSVACGNPAALCLEVPVLTEVLLNKVVLVCVLLETAWAYLINRAAMEPASS